MSSSHVPPTPRPAYTHHSHDELSEMKFIHIADRHVGLATLPPWPATGMNIREKQICDDFLGGIDRIIAGIPDALMHSADLFNTVKPKPGHIPPSLRPWSGGTMRESRKQVRTAGSSPVPLSTSTGRTIPDPRQPLPSRFPFQAVPGPLRTGSSGWPGPGENRRNP